MSQRKMPWPPMLILLLVMIATSHKINANRGGPLPAAAEQEDTKKPRYGLGGHTLNDDQTMKLTEGSKLLTEDDEQLKNYQNTGRGEFQDKGCRVSKEAEYWVVHYDEVAARNGCAVDILMRDKPADNSKILFTAEIKNNKGLVKCLTVCRRQEVLGVEFGIPVPSDHNIIPFVYSQNNAMVKELENEPRYSDKYEDCGDLGECISWSDQTRCINFTALEIRWDICDRKFAVWLKPVAEPKSKQVSGVIPNKGKTEATINVTSGEAFNIRTDGWCIPESGEGEAVPTPMAWPIDNSQPGYSGKFLFVFHLLPQKAARIFGSNLHMMDQSPPAKGTPKCIGEGRSLTIKFPVDNLEGILVTPTNLPTTTTQEQRTTPTTTPKETTTPTQKTSSTTSNTTVTTTTSSAPPERNNWATIIPITIGGLLLLIILAAVLVYFLCQRRKKKKNKYKKDDANVLNEYSKIPTVPTDMESNSNRDAKTKDERTKIPTIPTELESNSNRDAKTKDEPTKIPTIPTELESNSNRDARTKDEQTELPTMPTDIQTSEKL